MLLHNIKNTEEEKSKTNLPVTDSALKDDATWIRFGVIWAEHAVAETFQRILIFENFHVVGQCILVVSPIQTNLLVSDQSVSKQVDKYCPIIKTGN
jgi:hypothetical protein